MKKVVLFFVFLFGIAFSTYAQNSVEKADDFGRIALNVFIPDDVLSDFPSAKKILDQRLQAIASMNGMGGNEAFPRFIITGNAYATFDEVLDGMPPKHVKTLEVMLSIGDGIEGVQFSSEVIEVKGVDDSENKAFIAALKKINPRNKDLKTFIDSAKEKIIAYYNSKCDFILKEAETLNANKDYDNALATLIEVPEVCKECYEKSMDYSKEVFKAKVENECNLKISDANALIAQDQWDQAASVLVGVTPDMACFPEVATLQKKITDHRCFVSIGKARGAWAKRDSKNASVFLSEVSYDSGCYPDAQALFKEISSSIDAQAKREWDLAYEKYNRNQVIKEQVNKLELELARSDQKIKVADANADRGIRVANAETQRKIDMLDADAKAYLTKKTADNQALLIKTMGNTAVEVAKANAKKKPPVYNYTVNKSLF
jgi:hypothetical protein